MLSSSPEAKSLAPASFRAIALRLLPLFIVAALAIAVSGTFVPAPASAQGSYIDLGVTITTDKYYSIGITVTNYGLADAYDVQVELAANGEPLEVRRNVGPLELGREEVLDGKHVWKFDRLSGGQQYTDARWRTRSQADGEATEMVKLTARISAGEPHEPESLLHNNYAEAYRAIEPGSISTAYPDYTIEAKVDNRAPQPGESVRFTIVADSYIGEEFVSDADHKNIRLASYISDVRVNIDLTEGLIPGSTAITRSDEKVNTTTYNSDTGVWDIGGMFRYDPDTYTLELDATLAMDAVLGQQCLTAEIFANPPARTEFSGFYDDPWDNVDVVCLGEPQVIGEGEIYLLTVYDCVGVTAPPCDDTDGVELVAWYDGQARQPEDIVVHIDEPVGRVDGVWRTGLDEHLHGARPAEIHPGAVARWWVPGPPDYNQHNFAVSDAGTKPGSFRILHAANTGFTLLDADNKPSWGPANMSASNLYIHWLFEFGALGTYVMDITGGATDTATGTAYTDTATYTFHVGPIADLTVRDVAPNPELSSDRRAFTIMAVNNGPSDAPAARVEIELPEAVGDYTVGQGDFDPTTGYWNIGKLWPKDRYRALHGQDGPTITFYTDAAAGEATARIEHDPNRPYSVTLDGTTHTVPVGEYNKDNNSAAISAAAGGRPAPAGLTATPESYTAVLLEWDALPEFLGSDTTHYEIEYLADEDGAQWARLVANTESFDGGDWLGTEAMETEYRHFTGLAGHDPQYRVYAWNTDGKRSAPSTAAVASLPAVAEHMVPETSAFRSATIWAAAGYDAPVAGEPVRAKLDDREADFLARSRFTPSQRSLDPCTHWVPRPDISVPGWVWQSSSDFTNDGMDSNDTWTDIPDDGGVTYIYTPVSGDIGKYLRATLTFGTPPVTTATRAFGPVMRAGPATAAPAGAANITGTGQAGVAMTARLDATILAAGANIVERWQWQRSDDYTNDEDDSNDTWIIVTRYGGCPVLQEPKHQYTPSSQEAGGHFRAYVYYNDSYGNLKRAQTDVVGPNAGPRSLSGALPLVSITAAVTEVAEGADGAVSATVSLSAASAETVTVDWQTTDGTADAGGDYTAAGGALTFAPGGPLAQKVSVAILDDTEHEANPETFDIRLFNPSNAAIHPNNDRVRVTITSDDPAPGSPPVFDAGTDAFTVSENTTAVGAVTATDPDEGDSVTFALNGGADAAKFAITPEGLLTFLTAPDHEQPTDSGGDNGYEVAVRASDGSLTADQTVTVTVTDAAENDATLKALSLADQDGNPVGIGAFDPATTDYAATVGGQVTGVTATATPNHPDATVATTGNTALAEGENPVTVTVTAEDGSSTQDYVITVTRAASDDPAPGSPPVFDAGTDAFTVSENVTAVGAVTATDPDEGDSVTFALNGGADESAFAITPEGLLTFLAAPDHEQPADSGGDNGYEVVVQATDGSLTADQTVTVTVTDAAEADATLKALSLADQDGNPVGIGAFDPATTAYTASVGSQVTGVAATARPNHPDATVAVIGGTALAEGENPVTVTVTAEDGSSTQDYVIIVTKSAAEAVNNAPIFDAGTNAFTVSENITAVGVVTATDPDDGDSVTFALNGGADESAFAITPEGLLTFLTAPDHEQPADSGGDNGYEVAVRASDGSLTADQTVTVTVTDAAENDATLKALSLADQDGNPVDIGAFDPATTDYAASVGSQVTGVTATARPNHPDATVATTGNTALAEGENPVTVTVTAEDGSSTQDYVIIVTKSAAEAVNNAPVFDAGTDAFTVAENITAVGVVTATDPDEGDSVTFALNGGADAAKFAITPEGLLTFLAAPDHEQPADSGGDNGYEVAVRASDGSLTADQTVTVTVTDAAENDATLEALSLADQDGNPVAIGAFDPATTDYAASVGNGVTGVTATARPNHPDATTAVTGGASLAEGENPVTVTVTAEDGSTRQEYTITVTRAAAEPSEKPGAVRHLSVSVGADSLTISWEAPDTGSAASGYDVDYDLAGAAGEWVTALAGGEATSVTVTGLAPGEYRIRVRATNQYGSSKWARDRVTVGG